jgi:phosphatidylglycerol lysyltransferase
MQVPPTLRIAPVSMANSQSDYQPLPTQSRLESWVQRYGTNSCSYVLLEGCKSYFTSSGVDGFLAYQTSAGIPLIAGDPVCSPADSGQLIRKFALAMERPVGAYQVSPDMLNAFRKEGFNDVQVGKEAIFYLDRFTLAGGQMELVRAATNKARREGLVITEHHPFAPGAVKINDELQEISQQWLETKGHHELGFMLGSLGLQQLSAKRYFIASSPRRIEGFIVCEPIYGRNGYYLDVTRRRSDAVRGTMELLTTEIFRLLRDEGYEMVSMGLAPLALLDDPDLLDHPVLTRLMRLVYTRFNSSYDFKLLYRYKAKYHPHAWEPRYFCFNQRRLSVGMVYAVLQVRNAVTLDRVFASRGFSDIVKTWKHAASLIIGLCSALLSSS